MVRRQAVRLFRRLVPVATLVALLASAIAPGIMVPQGVEAGPSPWTPDTLVYDDSNEQRCPAMATDSDGHLWVAFQDYREAVLSYGITVCESTDSGATWTERSRLYCPDDLLNPDMAIDPYSDRVYVVYEREAGPTNHDIYCGIGTGTRWTWEIIVDKDNDDDRNPSVTCEYQYGIWNGVYVAYEYLWSNDDRDLVFAESQDGTSWTGWTVAGADGPDVESVYCESDITTAEGNIYIACRHSENYIPLANESDILVYISYDWGATWTQSSVLTDSSYPQRNPSIAATHGGNTVAVAMEWDEPGEDAIVMSVSDDSGSTWSGWGSVDAGNVHSPSLTVDGMGTTSNDVYGKIHVAWEKDDCVYHLDIDSADDSNSSGWEQVSDISKASSMFPGIAITTQQRGGVWYPCVAWTDYRNPSYDIYYSTMVTCGTMNVDTTTWSPTVASGQTAIHTGTVSATTNPIQGVRVAKTSGPAWLSVNPGLEWIFLGTIFPGLPKTFTVTATPPSGISGSFPYVLTVSNVYGTPSAVNVTGTITVTCCGTMSVDPYGWSALMSCGQTATHTGTVSAATNPIQGVSVARTSGPAWLTVSPASLGTISPGSPQTFTITAAPPLDSSGTFHYVITVSNTCGTPASITVTGTITVCGTMSVSPTTWSPTVTCGQTSTQVVTVSATTNHIQGVYVAKTSGPAWLTVSATSLGDISPGSPQTFTMTASPPPGTSGSFPYVITVGNTCGTPSSVTMMGPITVTCPTLGSISGAVYEEDGVTPIAWAYVYAAGPSSALGPTGANGRYTLAGLTTGSYTLYVWADGHAMQYYQGVYKDSQVTPVWVTAPNDTPNIDFIMQPGGSISGRVLNESGDPIEGAWVQDDGNWACGAWTAADGTYTMRGLIPGNHLVVAQAGVYVTEYYDNVYDPSSATPVTVTALNDTPGIDFTLGPGIADSTPPTTPVVADDGATTTSTSQLHASWSSSDPESGISEYQYAIGTTSGGMDVVAWTSEGTNTQVTKTGLSLNVGTTYYFSVKARNGAGLWSGVGVSDGIQVIGTVTPPTAVVIPATQKVAPGGTFTVDVVIDPSGYGLSAGEVNIAFDPSAMSVVDIVFGDLLGANPLVGAKQIDNTLGTAKCALARVGTTTPPTSAGIFATITLTAKSKAGTYAIDITSIGLADEDFNDIPGIVITDGNVTVGYPKWDINQDGKVDYKDLAILGAHYGQTTSPPYPAWDINQDGKVDYRDLATLGAHYGEAY